MAKGTKAARERAQELAGVGTATRDAECAARRRLRKLDAELDEAFRVERKRRRQLADATKSGKGRGRRRQLEAAVDELRGVTGRICEFARSVEEPTADAARALLDRADSEFNELADLGLGIAREATGVTTEASRGVIAATAEVAGATVDAARGVGEATAKAATRAVIGTATATARATRATAGAATRVAKARRPPPAWFAVGRPGRSAPRRPGRRPSDHEARLLSNLLRRCRCPDPRRRARRRRNRAGAACSSHCRRRGEGARHEMTENAAAASSHRDCGPRWWRPVFDSPVGGRRSKLLPAATRPRSSRPQSGRPRFTSLVGGRRSPPSTRDRQSKRGRHETADVTTSRVRPRTLRVHDGRPGRPRPPSFLLSLQPTRPLRSRGPPGRPRPGARRRRRRPRPRPPVRPPGRRRDGRRRPRRAPPRPAAGGLFHPIAPTAAPAAASRTRPPRVRATGQPGSRPTATRPPRICASAPVVVAAVDCGSNSVHLLVAVVARHRIEPLVDESVFLGLGPAADERVFGEAARGALVAALVGYGETARRLGAR